MTFLRNIRKFFGLKFQIKTTESKIVPQEEEEEDVERIKEEKEESEETEVKVPQ